MSRRWVLWSAWLAAVVVGRAVAEDWRSFAELALWDDGLSEMCYYDAQDTIYGKSRRYARIHMFNRQWMGGESGVKAEADAPDAVPVFKLNIAEEVPTENYNYRYLTTVFLRRGDLTPFKLAASSQEWCGTTFKHLRWGEAGLKVQCFSYFGDEGDKSWEVPGQPVPFEGLFVLARAVAAVGGERKLELLPAMRSTHEIAPNAAPAVLAAGEPTRRIQAPAGKFEVRRVELTGEGVTGWFDVEAVAPWRLIAFSAGGVEGKLRFAERRAYWDRSWGSGFHKAGEAP